MAYLDERLNRLDEETAEWWATIQWFLLYIYKMFKPHDEIRHKAKFRGEGREDSD